VRACRHRNLDAAASGSATGLHVSEAPNEQAKRSASRQVQNTLHKQRHIQPVQLNKEIHRRF
jgi:hypothetical protein